MPFISLGKTKMNEIKEKEESKKEMVIYGKDRLLKNAKIGMKKVDPLDIRPPQILLAQKLSDFSQLTSADGKQAKIGEYFHTGKLEVMKNFDAYILYAAKVPYVDRRHPEEGEKMMYKAIGVLADDFSLFGINFRSSSIYTLSPLFSVAASQNRPMFSFLVTFESKLISGDKGEWYIPVCRVKKVEDNPEKLIFLENMALGFDAKGDKLTGQNEYTEDDNMPF